MENQREAELGNSDIELVRKLRSGYDAIKGELHKIIIGQDRVLDELLTCIFSRGHALLVGVPGLAKTLMIRSVSQCLTLSFSPCARKIQSSRKAHIRYRRHSLIGLCF